MKSRSHAGLLAGILVAAAAVAHAQPVPAAWFGFTLDITGPQSGAGDGPRLQALDAQMRDLLARSGRYRLVDIAPVAAAAQSEQLRSCNGCEVPLAARVGATASVIGWVQKVSNLILNINVVVRSVPDGRVVHAASVDIRGDTDESWSRGLAYLMRYRLFPAAAQ